MQRWKLVLEFDGQPFVGWQRQKDGVSVQALLEESMFRFCGEHREVITSGRTDAGVHALGLAAHVDIARPVDPSTIINAINYYLHDYPITVLDAIPVPETFHARFSCTRRAYLYKILNRVSPPTLEKGRVWHIRKRLDDEAMNEAATHLLGHHDFSTFRDSFCQAKSPLRTLDHLAVRREGDMVIITAAARSFLHHQVRNMVGTLKLVGEGKWTGADVKIALERKDRTAGGPTAPADGLYFVSASYDATP